MSASGTGGSRRAATLITLAIMIAVIAVVSLGAYAMIGSRAGGGGGYATADLVPVQRMDFDITTTAMGELAAAQQLVDHPRLAFVFADVEDSDDVGVGAESPHGLRLAREAGATHIIEAFHLDEREGYVAIGRGVVGGCLRGISSQ